MTDDMPEGPPDRPHGFAVPVPLGALFEGLKNQHDREHMAHDAMSMRLNNFLDELSIEHLMTLRHILNQDQDSASNNFFDGQIYTLLRVVHHVDGNSGSADLPLPTESTESD
jgi:DNA-binding MltR family transcriptional regulator